MIIHKTLRNTTLALLFLIPFIPLYVDNGLFFPFITGKAFAFRFIVEIAFALWLLLLLRDKKYAPKFSAISLIATLFVIAIFVADVAGVNPLRSLWSNFERMEGWVVLIHLWAYFIVATSMFGSSKDNAENKHSWQIFFNITLVAASIVGIYGFFQIFGWAAIHQGSSRIDASLGNAAYMAVYMLIHTFIAFFMSIDASKKNKKGLFWTYIILGIIFAYLLFETATRGTILGLAGGIMLASGIYAVFGKGESKKMRWVSGGIIAIIILAGVALVSAKETSFVKNNQTLNRLATISWKESQGQARGYIWPMAVKGAFESPKTAIIGSGQENFNYIFNAKYDPKMWSQEQWFDRAHSVFLDWLVAGGLVGLLLYLSLFIFAIIFIWKSNAVTFKKKSVLTGLVVAYGIHNIFVFDNLISYISFFTILAFIHNLYANTPIKWLQKSDTQTENAIVVRDYIFLPVIVILFLVTMYFINVRPIQANHRLISAMISCSGGTTPSAQLYGNALKLNQTVSNQEIREQLLACGANVLLGGYSETVKVDFYNLAKKEIETQIATTPNDARSYVLGGGFYNNIGDWNTGRPLLEKAHELSPTKQTISFELATNYLNSGKEKEGAILLENAYNDAPENKTARIAYVASLILTGQESKAQEIMKNNPDIKYDDRILGVYVRLKQYQKVIDGYKILIEKEPTNIAFYGNLAAAYVENGQLSLAISLLESMKTKFPQVKDQIEQAIKDVRAGKK